MGEESNAANKQIESIEANNPGTSLDEDGQSQKSGTSGCTGPDFKPRRRSSEPPISDEEEIQELDLDENFTKLDDLTLPEMEDDEDPDKKKYHLKSSRMPNAHVLIEEKARLTAEREEKKRREAVDMPLAKKSKKKKQDKPDSA